MQPLRAARAGDPHNFVRIYHLARCGEQPPGLHLRYRGIAVHLHLARCQHLVKAAAHASAVRGQYGGAAGEQVKGQLVRVAAYGLQHGAQTVLHGQQQLYPTSSRAHHGHGGLARVALHALQEGEPAFVKPGNRLHRHRVLRGAGHATKLRGRANVDRQHVIGHGRAVAAQHGALRAVKAHHLVTVQARTGKHGQAA